MVAATFDPIRVPVVNLSQKEIDEIAGLIEQGQLPKDFLDRHFDAVDANVFGEDAPKDRKGNRLEQGHGSPKNQTANSVAAYRKYGKDEPNYAEHLKRMEAELAACDAVRKANAPRGARRAVRGRA